MYRTVYSNVVNHSVRLQLIIIFRELRTNRCGIANLCRISGGLEHSLRDAYAGEGAGDARIPLHAECFRSLLSCEGAFSSVVDSLVLGNFSRDKSPDPQVGIL